MSSPQDVLSIVVAYCTRHSTGQISFQQLFSFIDRFLLENPEKEKSLEDLLRMNGRNLLAHLTTLEESSDLKLNRTENAISSITYPRYYLKTIEEGYSRIDDKPEIPFPTEDSLRLNIAPEDFKIVEIKSDFINWLNKNEDNIILRLNFPDGIQSLITTSTILSNRMVTASVQKIRHYLRDSKNLAYMRQRLTPVFRSREIAVKELLHTVVTSPEQAAGTIFEPSDFTYQLWTQLSTNLVKEYGPKSDKMAEEHGFCQAAFLIGYYNMYFRSRVQKKKEEESSLSFLIQNLKKPPFAYRISQIYEFTDDKGILLVKRCDKERINEFLQMKIKAQEGKDTPEILAFSTLGKEEFFMLYSSVAQFISENLIKAQKDMREFYKSSWLLALRGDVEFTTMHADEVFRGHIEDRMKRHWPILQAVLTFPIVYFASRVEGIPPQVRNDLSDIMVASTQRLKTIDQIMKIQRKKILEDAKILLPAWMVIPGIRTVMMFLRRLFLGKEMAGRSFTAGFDHEGQIRYERMAKKKSSESSAETVSDDDSEGSRANGTGNSRQAQITAFRQSAKLLESSFLSENEILVPTLEQLVERWNQLLDPRAKADLLTDVNSLCKDYLRKQKAFAKQTPPSAETIKIYARKLVEGDLLSGIRNKKDLLRYVELYYLFLLENAGKQNP